MAYTVLRQQNLRPESCDLLTMSENKKSFLVPRSEVFFIKPKS